MADALLGPDGTPARASLPFGFQPQAEIERSFAASRPRRRAYFHWGEQPNVDAEQSDGHRVGDLDG